MRFQKKILLYYVALLAVSVLVICVLYYQSSRKRYVAEEYSYLNTLAGQMQQQLDMEYNSMREATESLLSDSAILDNLKILATMEEDSHYRAEAEKKINIRLNTYHIVKNYYRVLIYNGKGDIFSSYDFDDRKIRNSIPEEQKEWIKAATGLKGRTVLIPLHQDPWGRKTRPEVYSLIREILGYGLAYVEVQQTEESLQKIFHIFDENIGVTAVMEDGRLLYGGGEGRGGASHRQPGSEKSSGFQRVRNQDTGRYELLVSSYSDLTGVTILLTEDQGIILKKMSGFLWMACAIMLLFVVLSALFIIRVSENVARPVNELRRQMEEAGEKELEAGFHIENSMDEIKALADAYERLIKRLKESLTNEKNLSYLQLQARYDLLQAQINPHFFHNVLNVISSRGLMTGDETICRTCESLSGMLRYATGNKTRFASVEDEVNYLNQYLYLMKQRYQHKLQYQIEVEERLKSQMVPKIVFQQIVENSIRHGFNARNHVMILSVAGTVSDDGDGWRMEFTDNGEGISAETTARLAAEMEEIREIILHRHQIVEMDMGGMGLLNTYARLILFFGDTVVFQISGCGDGTTVTIEAPFAEADFMDRHGPGGE